jgi:hypothetical protein
VRKKDMADIFGSQNEWFQKLKMDLEAKLVAIDAEQKSLEEKIEPMRQKVAIQELTEAVRKRRDELAVLRLQKKRLEDESNGL